MGELGNRVGSTKILVVPMSQIFTAKVMWPSQDLAVQPLTQEMLEIVAHIPLMTL